MRQHYETTLKVSCAFGKGLGYHGRDEMIFLTPSLFCHKYRKRGVETKRPLTDTTLCNNWNVLIKPGSSRESVCHFSNLPVQNQTNNTAPRPGQAMDTK